MTRIKKRCGFETDAGAQCKANAQQVSGFCFFHDPAVADKRAAARRAGGLSRTRPLQVPADVQPKQLHTASDVARFLAETINQVRGGKLDTRLSNAIGYLSGILLSAIEKSDYERRLSALELATAQARPSHIVPLESEMTFDFVQRPIAAPSQSNDKQETNQSH
jgi:hypothetical protein